MDSFLDVAIKVFLNICIKERIIIVVVTFSFLARIGLKKLGMADVLSTIPHQELYLFMVTV